MAFDIKIDDVADENINDAIKYYESLQEDLGMRFYLYLNSYFDILKTEIPDFRFIEETGFKQLPLTEFPYVIIYKIKDSTIFIMSVFNTSQEPTKRFK